MLKDTRFVSARSSRRQLFGSAATAAALSASFPAVARAQDGATAVTASAPQDQTPSPPTAVPGAAVPAAAESDRPAAGGDIVVTGSRIRRPDLEGGSPVAVIGAESLARKGTINVQDAINELPQLGIGQGNRNQNFDSLNNGYNVGGDFLNLRNLGVQRTLVVVNGRRFIGGDPGTSSVDLNTIPSIMVNRIDVVTGAASAVYGADAVSGVVNIILRDNYRGVMLTGHTGISSRGDAFEWQAGGLIGGSFADDRGGAVVAVEHNEQKGYLGKDRSFGQFDSNNFAIGPIAGSTAIPGEVITNNGRVYSFDINNNLVLNSSLPLEQRRYQRQPERSLGLPISRTNLAVAAHYDLVEHGGDFSATLYTENMYSRTKSFLQYEARAQFFTGSPRLFTPLDSSLNQILVPANNPYAQALVPVIGPIPAAGLNVVSRLTELGNNAADIDRQTYRFLAGLRGDLPGGFKYDMYYQYGNLKVSQRDVNAFNRTKLAQTLNVNNNGTPLNFADDFCADPIARSQGCVPFNLFGNPTGQNTAVKAYIADNSGVDTEASQNVVSGFVSGNLFTLPAGPIAVVLGAEYRKEEAEIRPSQSYLDFTSSLRFQRGLAKSSYDVKEIFGELNVPVLADKPFFHRLEFGAAARLSDYSTVGRQFAWNVRGEWEVVPGLRLRGVYSTAVRAPNLVELYSPETGVITIVQDPCDTVAENGTSTVPTGNRAAACRADLGGGATGFNQTQLQSNSIVSLTSGDPSLSAEKAKTYTLGAVLRPRGAFRGLTATVDYFNIRIDNVLSTLALQDAVNQCYDQASRPALFCSLITRDASQQIIAVRNRTFNAATESVSGLDARVNFNLPLERLSGSLPGTLDLSGGWSHLFKHEFVAREGASVDRRQGQVGDFTNRYDISAVYAVDGVSLSWQTRIYGKALADTTIPASSINAGPNHIPSVAYSDFQASFSVGERFDLSLGVKNVFDKNPPVITSPARTVVGVQPTVSTIYDTRGRFFYTTARVRF